jgi:hypothetical protein
MIDERASNVSARDIELKFLCLAANGDIEWLLW